MEFGVFINASIPRPWTPGVEARVFAGEVEYAVLAEEAGIQYCWMPEHHFLDEYCHVSAPEMFLAHIAARTKRIRLAHGIVDMQPQINHPIRVAERIATLDLLSQGRAELGTGKGTGIKEWGGFGVRPEDATGAWEEAIRCVLAAWQTEEFSWNGRYIQVPGPRNVVPKPWQRPHPPLWTGSNRPESVREAGQRGIGALLSAHSGFEDVAERVRLYRDGVANPQGRFSDHLNLKTAAVIGGLCERDDRRAMQDYFDLYISRHAPIVGRHLPHAPTGPGKVKDIDSLVASGSVFAGDPQRIIEAVQRIEEAGLDQLILLIPSSYFPKERILRSLDLWAEHILPRFKHRAVAGAPSASSGQAVV